MNVPPVQGYPQPPAPKKKPRWLLAIGAFFVCCCCGIPSIGIIRSATMTPEERAKVLADAKAQAEKASAEPAAKGGAKEKPAKKDLEAFDVKGVNEGYASYATGKVRNNTDHKYSYVQVEVNLLDKEGNLVGSTLANVNNLDPGKVWVFRAPVLERSAKRFEVKDVTGF